MIPFEDENREAYVLLMRIEIALRECLSISLREQFGVRWHKQIDGQLLANIKESQKEENRRQFCFLRLGPLYYLTFGELLTLLRNKKGRVVADKFGGDKFLFQLENLLTPRNAVGHSRAVSNEGLLAIKALYAQIEAVLTTEGLKRILQTPEAGLFPEEFVKAAIPILRKIKDELVNLPSFFDLPEIFKKAADQYWWHDDSLAGFNLSSIEAAISLLEKYNLLPRGVGANAVRHQFFQEHNVARVVEAAVLELERINK